MAINVQWDPHHDRIIQIQFNGSWTADQFIGVHDHMIATMMHRLPIAFVLDLTNSTFLPTGNLIYATRYVLDRRPPHPHITVVVSDSLVQRRFFEFYRLLYNRLRRQDFAPIWVATMQDAYDVILSHPVNQA